MIKILLADDETDSRDAIVQYIDWEGHGLELVGAAGDGAEALEMIKTRKPDIAILDIYMPKLSGIQVIERCRREMPDAPAFIIISGYNDFGCAQQAIRLKVEEYLLKPFLARELMDAVQRALLQVELRRGGAPGDFVSFVLSCQQESPRAAHGRYSMELERRVLNVVSVGSREDVTRSVDEFLAECVLNQTIPAALSYGQMLYFEICRLIMERTGSFPAENAFFKRSWTQDGVYEQLAQALHRAALDAHELISTGKRRSSVVITAVNYIEQHYAEELTLGKIAEEIYVSPPYLSNIFKEKMDINLMSYIHKVRVEKAKKLLLESSLSIQKVAELVGYRHEMVPRSVCSFAYLSSAAPAQIMCTFTLCAREASFPASIVVLGQ